MITDDWGPDEFLAISRFMKVTVTNNEKVTPIFKIKMIAMLDYSIGLERKDHIYSCFKSVLFSQDQLLMLLICL